MIIELGRQLVAASPYFLKNVILFDITMVELEPVSVE